MQKFSSHAPQGVHGRVRVAAVEVVVPVESRHLPTLIRRPVLEPLLLLLWRRLLVSSLSGLLATMLGI